MDYERQYIYLLHTSKSLPFSVYKCNYSLILYTQKLCEVELELQLLSASLNDVEDDVRAFRTGRTVRADSAKQAFKQWFLSRRYCIPVFLSPSCFVRAIETSTKGE